MKIIKETSPNKVIRRTYQESLEIEKSGIYLVEITARAKSWWQNHLTTFFSDDGLYLKINEIKLDRQGANWNGNSLKNLSQTIVFVVYLEKGQHTLNLFPSYKPYLQSIKIYQTESSKIDFIPTINNPAEDGNRRPWYGFVLINLGLKNILVKASAGKGKKILRGRSDDDDLQFKINSHISKNPTPKSHKNWFWCGKILKGELKEFSQAVNLPVGWHFLELLADRSPKLEKVELEIEYIPQPQPSPIRKPTKDDPKWTGDFSDDSEQILLARLIFGEARGEPDEARIWIAGAVLNRVSAKVWRDTIHQVILQPKQYDPFKKTDKNYPIIIDPLKNADQETTEIWYRCYDIAEDIISRKLPNPTEATHFHGKGITREEFEKEIVPHGRFLRKIGKTYFYWSPN